MDGSFWATGFQREQPVAQTPRYCLADGRVEDLLQEIASVPEPHLQTAVTRLDADLRQPHVRAAAVAAAAEVVFTMDDDNADHDADEKDSHAYASACIARALAFAGPGNKENNPDARVNFRDRVTLRVTPASAAALLEQPTHMAPRARPRTLDVHVYGGDHTRRRADEADTLFGLGKWLARHLAPTHALRVMLHDAADRTRGVPWATALLDGFGTASTGVLAVLTVARGGLAGNSTLYEDAEAALAQAHQDEDDARPWWRGEEHDEASLRAVMGAQAVRRATDALCLARVLATYFRGVLRALIVTDLLDATKQVLEHLFPNATAWPQLETLVLASETPPQFALPRQTVARMPFLLKRLVLKNAMCFDEDAGDALAMLMSAVGLQALEVWSSDPCRPVLPGMAALSVDEEDDEAASSLPGALTAFLADDGRRPFLPLLQHLSVRVAVPGGGDNTPALRLLLEALAKSACGAGGLCTLDLHVAWPYGDGRLVETAATVGVQAWRSLLFVDAGDAARLLQQHQQHGNQDDAGDADDDVRRSKTAQKKKKKKKNDIVDAGVLLPGLFDENWAWNHLQALRLYIAEEAAPPCGDADSVAWDLRTAWLRARDTFPRLECVEATQGL